MARLSDWMGAMAGLEVGHGLIGPLDPPLHCARKMIAMLTRETSELTGPDLRPPSRIAFRTSPVTVLLCYFIYLRESNLK